MKGFFQTLGPEYQQNVLEKWEGVIDADEKLVGEQKRITTAMVLENTQNVVNESYGAAQAMSQFGSMGAGLGGGGGVFGSAQDFGVNDARVPSIVIPTAQRVFPQLLAHDIVGVQPMSGPVGFAFALRMKYGVNGKGATDINGTELGYNTVDSAFTGASGGSGVGDMWDSYAGSGNTNFGGTGESLENAEWWNIGEDMPMAKMGYEKSSVTARSRKMAAGWSLETAEDMMAMQGVNIQTRMIDALSYEVQAELDRELVTTIVKKAITGGMTSSWSPVSADGRNQMERIATFHTHLHQEANRIRIKTRRGAATFCVASPDVTTMIERGTDFKAIDNHASVDGAKLGVSRNGTLKGGTIKAYCDTFAGGNYALLGYKGSAPEDTGVIYCPYVPLQLMQEQAQENFTPRIGVRTRYGLLDNMFNPENFYHFIQVKGLTTEVLAASGGRLFMYN